VREVADVTEAPEEFEIGDQDAASNEDADEDPEDDDQYEGGDTGKD
jgi:hypothetical protein